MVESVSQRNFYGKDTMHYMAAPAVTKHDFDCAPNFHIALQDCMHHPIAFLFNMMGNIMHLHQALQQPNTHHFVNSVIKEIYGNNDCKHWVVTLRSEVPKDTIVLPSVWAVQCNCNRNFTTGKITKHKA
jgi:hypothetical protein